MYEDDDFFNINKSVSSIHTYAKVSDHEHSKVLKSSHFQLQNQTKQSENLFLNTYITYFDIHNTSMYKKHVIITIMLFALVIC